jgi:hypothetical protein
MGKSTISMALMAIFQFAFCMFTRGPEGKMVGGSTESMGDHFKGYGLGYFSPLADRPSMHRQSCRYTKSP